MRSSLKKARWCCLKERSCVGIGAVAPEIAASLHCDCDHDPGLSGFDFESGRTYRRRLVSVMPTSWDLGMRNDNSGLLRFAIHCCWPRSWTVAACKPNCRGIVASDPVFASLNYRGYVGGHLASWLPVRSAAGDRHAFGGIPR